MAITHRLCFAPELTACKCVWKTFREGGMDGNTYYIQIMYSKAQAYNLYNIWCMVHTPQWMLMCITSFFLAVRFSPPYKLNKGHYRRVPGTSWTFFIVVLYVLTNGLYSPESSVRDPGTGQHDIAAINVVGQQTSASRSNRSQTSQCFCEQLNQLIFGA